MPKLTADALVSEMLGALRVEADRRGIPSVDALPDSLSLEVEVRVAADDIESEAIDMGYVHSDDAMNGLDPCLLDLSDGLRALIEGDRSMAATLLARALSEWPAAGRVVEDVLHGRTRRDRRQCVLALAA